MKTPGRIDFTPEEIEGLLDRLASRSLKEEDYPLLSNLIEAMVWLSFSLKEKELSIKRLRNIFGIKTESAEKLLAIAQGKMPQNETSSSDQNKKEEKKNEEDEKKPKDKKKKNHGHRPSSDYSEAKLINVAHQSLYKGANCPDCLKGKLFQLKPGVVLRIVGQPWLQVEIYRPERLRCSTCGKVFSAKLPEEASCRVDYSAKAIVTLLKYRAGVPFYRQEQIQETLALPISASEIWEMTEDVADSAAPIFALLCRLAADAELLHNDDTHAKILSRMKEIKEDQPERTGTFTTCILAKLLESQIKIGLFFTGAKHAGENLDDILSKRAKNIDPPIQECDALSHNVPKNHETKVANCLAHLRRKFTDLVELWPKEVSKIIGLFSVVFANEKKAPEDPKERLKWHQEKSAPLMDELKEFCDSLLSQKKVEPNSSMGKAIAYLNNHWEAFTLFLHIPNVPLCNNDAERLLKRVVLNRKNAYFFRNETGAKIADILMSVMETCVQNNINPHDYLIAVQKYCKEVFQKPEEWLPWKYQETLKAMSP